MTWVRKNKGIFGLILINREALIGKGIGMVGSLLLYISGIYFFGNMYALSHASFLLVFGFLKAGGGYAAVSAETQAIDFVRSRIFSRILLSLIAYFSLSKILGLALVPSTVMALPLAFLWLRTFDGHLTGNRVSSFLNSFVPVITNFVIFLFFYLSLNDEINLSFDLTVAGVFSVFLLGLMAFFRLKSQFKYSFLEILNALISPSIVSGIETSPLGRNPANFVVFRIFEGLAQVCSFILINGKSEVFLRRITIGRVAVYYMSFLLASMFLVFSFGYHLSMLTIGVFVVFHTILMILFLNRRSNAAVPYMSFMVIVTLISMKLGLTLFGPLVIFALIVLVLLPLELKT